MRDIAIRACPILSGLPALVIEGGLLQLQSDGHYYHGKGGQWVRLLEDGDLPPGLVKASIPLTARASAAPQGSVPASTFQKVHLDAVGLNQIQNLTYDEVNRRLKNTAPTARQFLMWPYVAYAAAGSQGRTMLVRLTQRDTNATPVYQPVDSRPGVTVTGGQTFCQLATTIALGPNETVEVEAWHANANALGNAIALDVLYAGVFIQECAVDALKGDKGTSGVSARVLSETVYGGLGSLGGSFTHTFNPASTHYELELLGAGGGGGPIAATASGQAAVGGGGGGGGYAKSKRRPVAGTGLQVVAGTRGNSVAGETAGQPGNSSTVTENGTLILTAEGGAGGTAGPAGTAHAATSGGGGGAVSGPALLYAVFGGIGGDGNRISGTVAISGGGGHSHLGFASGGTSGAGAIGSTNSLAPGSGGTGAHSSGGITAPIRPGGTGGVGMCVVREFG